MHVPSFLCQSVPELEIAYMYICLFTSLGSVLVPFTSLSPLLTVDFMTLSLHRHRLTPKPSFVREPPINDYM